MGRFDDIARSVAELIGESRDEEPEPEGYAEDRRGGATIEGGFLEHDPPKDIGDYWSIYKKLGPVNSAINNFASEVIEPGWYITADSEETAEQLSEYFSNVAILNTETDVNAADLMERMIIEREVRGTVFLEKVDDSQGREQALYPLQNDTITIYTKPGKNMLPAPDDEAAEPFNSNARPRHDTPFDSEGNTAAYVQFDDTDPHWDEAVEVKFTRDRVIKWVRDADIGDARGTSRIETIADRAEGLIRKLDNNDAAIESKAWPQIIFNLGTEDNPWSEEEATTFLENYEDDTLEPGTMVAVSGDVSTDEFAGETADIADDLNFDVNMIMSGLPGPVYATGGFSQNVAPAVAQQQGRQFKKEVRKTRREIENLFTPYLRDVAEDYDLDAPESVELHLGRPNGEVAPEDVEGNIIQYQSTVDTPEQGQSSNQTQDGDSPEIGAPTPGQTNQANRSGNAPTSSDTSTTGFADRTEQNEASIMTADLSRIEQHDDVGVDELADPRLVSTRAASSEIADVIADVFVDARESALTEFETTFADAAVSGAAQFEGTALRAAQQTLDESSIRSDVRDRMIRVVEDTVDTLSQPNHTPTMDIDMRVRHRQQARMFANSVENQVNQAVDDMMDSVSTQVRRSAQHGETASVIADRVRSEWSDDELERRAELIARMETNSAVNAIKLSEYDRHPRIDGIEVINPCTPGITPLCRDLSNCDGDAAVAWFDADDNISDQLQSQTTDARLFDGFTPLPPAPPFHFGCRSEIVPKQRDSNQ